MRVCRVIVLFCVLLSATLGATELRDLAFDTTAPACYQRVEAVFRLTARPVNPYDPAEIRVDALIDGPGGAREFPCFYRVPVDTTAWREQPETARWHFRYAFRREGRYRVRFRVTDRTTWESPATEIAVAGSQGSGFVRVDREQWPDWILDDGSRLYPVGCNAAWSSGDRTGDYRRWIDAFSTNGIRVMRVWLVGFARQELEWSRDLYKPWNENYGLGRYNQKVAAWLDALVDYAAARGVYLQLVLEQHGEWSTEVDSNWEFNPYNRAHGGFLYAPTEFFTSPRAIRLAHARYRYIVARWGYSPAVAAWEIFNEVDNTDAYRMGDLKNEIAAWHRDAANLFKTLDLAPRPVTSSASVLEVLLALDRGAPGLDMLNFHAYDDRPARAIEVMADAWLTAGGRKPLMCGEFGMHLEQAAGDLRGDPVRQTLWSAAFRRMPAWYWNWDIAEAHGRFASYRAYTRFWKSRNITGWLPVRAAVPDAPPCEVIRLAPGLAWEPSRVSQFEVNRFGECSGISEMSAFLQGNWQREMNSRSASFRAVFKADGRFMIVVGAVSGTGTNVLGIGVDDQPMVAKSLQGAGIVGVTLGAGPHTVCVTNAGQDWIQVSRFELSGVAAGVVRAEGLRNGGRMIVYVCDTRGALARELRGLTLELVDVGPGVYDFSYFDPGSGLLFGRAVGQEAGGRLRAPLPAFRGDLAAVVEWIAP